MQRIKWTTILAATAFLALGLGVGPGLHQAPATEPTDQGTAASRPEGSKVAAPVPPRRRQVQISISVLQGDPLGSQEAGTLKTLTQPTLVTQNGCACECISGG